MTPYGFARRVVNLANEGRRCEHYIYLVLGEDPDNPGQMLYRTEQCRTQSVGTAMQIEIGSGSIVAVPVCERHAETIEKVYRRKTTRRGGGPTAA